MESLLKKSFVALNQNNKMTWIFKDIKRLNDKLKDDVRIRDDEQSILNNEIQFHRCEHSVISKKKKSLIYQNVTNW